MIWRSGLDLPNYGGATVRMGSRYKGSVIWLTREDLPGVDVEIRFRVFDSEGDSGIFADGYYRFGIRAISYDGRKSPLVVLRLFQIQGHLWWCMRLGVKGCV